MTFEALWPNTNFSIAVRVLAGFSFQDQAVSSTLKSCGAVWSPSLVLLTRLSGQYATPSASDFLLYSNVTKRTSLNFMNQGLTQWLSD